MKNIFLLLLFLPSMFSLKMAAQPPEVFTPEQANKVESAIENSTQFGNLYCNNNASLMLPKSPIWSQPSIAGIASIPNRKFWKAQGNGGSQAGKRMQIGMVVGGVLGGLIGLAVYKEPTPSKNPLNYNFDLGREGSAVLGALGGLTAGAIIGLSIKEKKE